MKSACNTNKRFGSTSSIQMDICDKYCDFLAKECAKLLPCLRIRDILKSNKCLLRKSISCTRCPYGVKLLHSIFKALSSDSKPPSRMIHSKPNSKANSRARLVARVSTFITEGGSGTCCASDAMMRPSLLRSTIPIPVVSLSANVAPSKLSLYQWSKGGVHLAGCLLLDVLNIKGLEWDSIRCSRECSSTLFSGIVGLPKRRLFLRFHKFHNTTMRSSGSFRPTKIETIKSMKHVLCLRVSWFQDGVVNHKLYNSGQWYRAWSMSSSCCLHISQRLLETILRWIKSVLVGSESLQAHHIRCFTLFETSRLQSFFQSYCRVFDVEELGW